MNSSTHLSVFILVFKSLHYLAAQFQQYSLILQRFNISKLLQPWNLDYHSNHDFPLEAWIPYSGVPFVSFSFSTPFGYCLKSILTQDFGHLTIYYLMRLGIAFCMMLLHWDSKDMIRFQIMLLIFNNPWIQFPVTTERWTFLITGVIKYASEHER